MNIQCHDAMLVTSGKGLYHVLGECTSIAKKNEILHRWRYIAVGKEYDMAACAVRCLFQQALLTRCFLAWASIL